MANPTVTPSQKSANDRYARGCRQPWLNNVSASDRHQRDLVRELLSFKRKGV